MSDKSRTKLRATMRSSPVVKSAIYRGGLFYDRHTDSGVLGGVAALAARPPRAVNLSYEVAAREGEVPNIDFLVATSAAGLLLVHGRRVTQLFDYKGFYGVTRREDRWYAFHKQGINGRILSFRIEADRAVDERTELAGLNRGVHQIDFIDDELWITDTYNDRLLKVPADTLGRARAPRKASVYYPSGRSNAGRDSGAHAHFNSVMRHGDEILVVAHNDTLKTKRSSELYRLDSRGEVTDKSDLGGCCCHNIVLLDGEPVSCRSVEGTVSVAGRDVLDLGAFTRGLSVAQDHCIVGASAAIDDRAARDDAQTRLVITDSGFQPLATIILDRTQVNEVRRVDADDLGLSATPQRE